MPRRYHIIITSTAANELTDICTFIQKDSPQNAAAVARKFIDAINSLELLPHRFKIHEHRTDPSKTVRSMQLRPFIVYYRTDDATQTVRILAIQHGARLQPPHFR
ncbi:MAG TPA: type II toxin-antitoxin system RelE/ParE family toxin [Tepidisphaeraceae bacterium]|nr:type II toxin-antitoxin system RelE/ParE family toxin [Tepidisphaeraceae bacterium]